MKLKKGDSDHREINSRQSPESEDNPPVPQHLINLLKMKAFREKLKTVKKKTIGPRTDLLSANSHSRRHTFALYKAYLIICMLLAY